MRADAAMTRRSITTRSATSRPSDGACTGGLAAICCAGLLVGAGTAAQDLEPSRIDVSVLGPQIGEIVPDFSLPDQNGAIRTRESIMGENGAMLVFIRSADW
jgi:hypothetical protein